MTNRKSEATRLCRQDFTLLPSWCSEIKADSRVFLNILARMHRRKDGGGIKASEPQAGYGLRGSRKAVNCPSIYRARVNQLK